MMDLPDFGQWVIAKSPFGPKPPFVAVTLSIGRNAGTVHSLLSTTDLTNVVRLAPNRFGARYDLGSHSGRIDGTFEDDKSLTLKLAGTINQQYSAMPARLVTSETVDVGAKGELGAED